MDQENLPLKRCHNCAQEIPNHNRFCSYCGQLQTDVTQNNFNNKWLALKEVAIFFGIEILCCASAMLNVERQLFYLYYIDAIMGVSALIFFGLDWSKNKIVLKWPNFSMLKLFGLIAGAIVASFLVSISMDYLNSNVFNKEVNEYTLFAPHKYGMYLMFATLALYPAIFEELAYRGYLMQKLLMVVDEKEAIYISSILFFIIHFSLVSIVWLLPFALFLGYLRIKTKTIWYGVMVHFFFNLTACVIDFYPLESFLKSIF